MTIENLQATGETHRSVREKINANFQTLINLNAGGGGVIVNGVTPAQLDEVKIIAEAARSTANLAATKADMGAPDFDFVAQINATLNAN